MNFSLFPKTLLITGASSGIGRQCAIQCSQMGATVIGLGRDADRLSETQAMLEQSDKHLFLSVDLLDHEALEAAIQKAVAQKGKIHGMINSAGISTTLPLRMMKPDKVDAFFQTNVAAAINLARIVTKPAHMAEEGASLVFITSVMATVGESGKSLYALTKGALLAAAKSLAIELAPKNIRVNCVSPGVVVTPMSKKSFYSQSEDTLNHIKSLHPLGLGTPEDVAAACVYLLSDASRWVTGSNLIVDGGYTAR
jgi:NAD(P)-dependent dehydrogenase (short-subunit alcohol dehydrogenase family)